MTDYQLTITDDVIRLADGAIIPNDPANADRAQYDAWRKAGGNPDPYVPPTPSPEAVRADTFRKDTARADLMTRLKNATPAQIDTFIDNNVTTIAQCRAVLKAMLKVIATDART